MRKSFFRRLDGIRQIMLIRIRHKRIGFANRRIFILKILPRKRLHQVAADEIENFLHYRLSVLPPSTGRLMPLI